ncbi:MAG: DUF3109 family protein, partial [Chitinophagia bacterium]|nr:DUF3109 family protein [Chitinophagia bacterium]
LVTPAVDGGICAYGYTDAAGIVKCGIERAWLAGDIAFRKPVSCHLFPIRVSGTPGNELLNYEPRKPMCRPACKQGKKLGVPVYRFLKEAIERRFGTEFYEALDAVAQQYPDGLSAA